MAHASGDRGRRTSVQQSTWLWPRRVNVNNIYIPKRSPALCQAVAGTRGSRRCGLTFGDAKAAEINENASLEQLLSSHRQLAPAPVAAREERGDAVRERPH